MSVRTPVDTPANVAEPGGVFKAFAAVREGVELATRYRILSNLSNEELAALGLTRKDIPRVTVNGWNR